MTKLKNITPSSVTLQVFNTPAPTVNNVSQTAVLVFQPGEVKDETNIRVTDSTNVAYNDDILNKFISSGILTRLP